ncbi:proline-rich protein 36-like [Archocentrus centrarchus]|uniref:proline-rich protein 36-like n=1 Tax=Archocentrus centrarchus TaxID=63155 RepID=UPI0011E9F0F7|nr:proline-rich protein 36-like [Archocentrus centrarchus]
MRSEKGSSATVCLAVAVILMCYLVQIVDCYRLKKTERREGRKEVGTLGARKGKIVFGEVLGKGSGLKPEVQDGKASANSSAEDETAYQMDFAGWSKGQTYDSSYREAAWRRMAPLLLCGGDRMKFRVVGRGVSQLALDQANAPPVSLTQVPSSCGYNMQRNSLSLIMMVPYDGCNVVQEGGSFVLPMRWQGIPVSLWCSKPVASALVTAAPPTQDPASNPYASKNPDQLYGHVPQSFFFPHQMYYPYHSAAVPEPASSIKQPEMPPFQQYPQFYSPLYPYSSLPVPTTTAPPTTTTTTAKPETFIPPEFLLPGYTPVVPPFLWPFPVPVPAGTQTTTNVDANPQLPQLPPYMHFLSHYPLFPQFVPLPQFPRNPNADMVAGTGSTDTMLPQNFAPFPQFVPQYPNNLNPGSETGSMDTILPQVQSHNFPYFQPQGPLMPNPSLSS